MNIANRHSDECVIIPVRGQAVFTVARANELTLPGKTKTGYFFRLIAVGFVTIGLWSFPTPTKAAVAVDDVIASVNAYRNQANLPPLHHDPRLNSSATYKTDDMFTLQYFAHASPFGYRGWHWMDQAGYAFTEAGENLAMDFTSGSDVVTAWMTSATHRDNILSGQYTDVGVAVQSGTLLGKKTMVIVAHFGRQTSVSTAATSIEPTPIPATPSPAPPATPEPIERAAVSQKTTAAIPALIPSLVTPSGVLVPTLVFTYASPSIPRPAVLGLATDSPVPALGSTQTEQLAWMILATLALSASVIGLASVTGPLLYPQPHRLQAEN